MWVAIVIAIIAILMVAFMPRPNVENARAAKLGDFQVPRAKHGDPVPLFWGTIRQQSPITIWYGDYKPVAITQKQPDGPFSSKRVVVGHKNYIGIDLALGIGPGVRLRKFWAGQKLAWSGDIGGGTTININLPDLFGGEKQQGGLVGPVTFYDGSFDPPQDPYLQDVLDPDIPAYNGICRALFKAFYIGTTTNLDFFSFELQRLTTGLDPTWSIMPNGLDANPMEICYDGFTKKYGGFGNSTAQINMASWLAAAETLYNEEMGMSFQVASSITGKDYLEEIMRQADGLLYQEPTTEEIVCKLIRQDYDVETLEVLDATIIKDLRNFSKTTWENTFNQCRVTFKERSNDYDDSVAIAQDFANINFQQRVKTTEINSPGTSTAEVANYLAARQLSFLNIPLYKADLVCNRKAAHLRPGDVFVLNWSPFGLVSMIMRISKVDIGELANGEVKISCVQDRYSTATPVFAAPEDSLFEPIDSTPQNITVRKLGEAPYFIGRTGLLNDPISNYDAQGRMYFLAKRPTQYSMYYDVLHSLNNFATEPTEVAENIPYSASGLLATAISATLNVSDMHIVSGITVTGLTDQEIATLKNGANLGAVRDGTALLNINDEWFVYVGYVDNGDGSVTLPDVYRAIFDTAPGAHAINDRVWFASEFDGRVDNAVAAGTHYYKLLDNSPSGSLSASGATVVSAAYAGRMGRPLPPDYLTIGGSRTPAPETGASTLAIAWRRRGRQPNEIKVYNDVEGTSAEYESATVQTRIRWRVGGGGYTTVLTSANTINIDVTGLVGVLEVIADSYYSGNSTYSLTADILTKLLDTPPAPSYPLFDLLSVDYGLYYFPNNETGGTSMIDYAGTSTAFDYSSSAGLGAAGLVPSGGTSLNASASYGIKAVTIPSSNELSIFTVVRFNSLSGLQPVGIQRDDGANRYYQLRSNGAKLEFVKIKGGVVTYATAANVFTAGVTHDVGCDIDYDGSTSTLRMYVDGVEVYSGSIPNTDWGGAGNVTLGYSAGGAMTLNGRTCDNAYDTVSKVGLYDDYHAARLL